MDNQKKTPPQQDAARNNTQKSDAGQGDIQNPDARCNDTQKPDANCNDTQKPDADHAFVEESLHLQEVKEFIGQQLDAIDISLGNNKNDIIRQKRYLWENIYEIDPAEIRSAKTVISEDHNIYAQRLQQKHLLQRQQQNPYFARIDFVYDGENTAEPLYIGLGGLRDKHTQMALIYDWRTPIASMYYDFDTGDACYEAPAGRLSGKITDKRQLKIKNGKLEYVLSSSFKVDDELLQRELANHGSTKMRNIAATIQREQNLAIRDQNSPILLVQGVAGSGKTSVALHRIAFLLYQNRGNLHSDEVLILSPNHIFAEYISNVLPELGEENICEMSFQTLAKQELAEICKFETKYQQLEYVAACYLGEDSRLFQIQWKNSLCFLKELKQFAKELERNLVTFVDYTFSLPGRSEDDPVRSYHLTADEMGKLYEGNFSSLPVFGRLSQIAERIADEFGVAHGMELSAAARDEIRRGIFGMCRTADVLELYADFLRGLSEKYPVASPLPACGSMEKGSLGASESPQETPLPACGSTEQGSFEASESPQETLLPACGSAEKELPSTKKYLLYEDVFPVLLLKIMLFGKDSSRFDRIRHVIVDEMQDYSMVQYELLRLLFRCNMTLLGDINQKMDADPDISCKHPLLPRPAKDSLLDDIREIFPGRTTLIRLEKSYRSTCEISEFCQKLGGLAGTSAFCRHGSAPVLEKCCDYSDMAAKIQRRLDTINPTETPTTAMICKTSAAAKKLYQALDPAHRKRCHRMIAETDDFSEGILITSSYLAKGLEFDLVIVPEATEEVYFSGKDRQILYVVCTRALHGLEIFYYGNMSPFLG